MPKIIKTLHEKGERTFKVIVAACSAGAALVSVLTFAQSHGIIDIKPPVAAAGAQSVNGKGGPGRAADADVAWIGITPGADTAASLGDTLHLTARVADPRGSTVVGAAIAWSSDSAEIATVNADGSVVAKGPGTTTIVAAAGSKLARARVTVRQRVVGARITGDSVARVRVGERLRLRSEVTDARSNLVARPAVQWRVADTAVARVDSLGEVAGVAPGRTLVMATVEGLTAQAQLDVVDVPATLTLALGDAQRAPAGRALPRPVEVEVLSARGTPVAGVPVRFAADLDAGQAEPATVETDAHGRARTRWTMGGAPGRQSLAITVDGVATPVVVRAESDPVAENVRTAPLSEAALGPAAGEVQGEVGIRVTDSLGRALPDVPVSWTARNGGSVVAAAPRTDSLGDVRVRWTLGRKAGVQKAVATIGAGRSVPPVTVSATALPGAAATFALVRGGGQTAPAGAPLPRPVALRVMDRAGNPVPGVTVTLAPAQGAVPDSAPVTDSTGTVLVAWTLGRTAGAQRLTATVSGVAAPLSLTARARPLAAANVTFADAAAEGKVGQPLAAPVWVTVTDVYENPVPDALVLFTAAAGSVSTSRVMTDAEGRASTRWRLGAAAGEQQLTAVVRGSDARAALAAQAVVPAKPAARAAAKAGTKPAASRKATARPAAKPARTPRR